MPTGELSSHETPILDVCEADTVLPRIARASLKYPLTSQEFLVLGSPNSSSPGNFILISEC